MIAVLIAMLLSLSFQDSSTGKRTITRRCIATADMRFETESSHKPPKPATAAAFYYGSVRRIAGSLMTESEM